ncbi:MAG: M1 family metallopeptidase [Vicinamibacterales bacterium]
MHRVVVQGVLAGLLWLIAAPAAAQTTPVVDPGNKPPEWSGPLRGAYGPDRANNDLLSYQLRVRVDPAAKRIEGTNRIRFRVLQAADRIQLDLYANLTIDRIALGRDGLRYERDANRVLVFFPTTLKAGRTYAVDVVWSGTPLQTGRFGGFVFDRDPTGAAWIYTACEDEGAALWWPNKDQWRDEVQWMEIGVEVPAPLVAVSNGRFEGKTALADGFTRWNWKVHYPINNYGVALNIGRYVQYEARHGNLPLTFFTLPEDQARARPQFAQVPEMLTAFERFVGPYPFPKDGYKLVQVPYAGMEHQSAIAYGNGFANGYRARDFTGVGISPRFDFIIVHESAHEYFGNAVSAADVSDMWLHEAWGTYLESLYVEHRWGKADMLAYTNGYKAKVKNGAPMLQPRGVHQPPTSDDQYFKGTLFLNTLRSIVGDDDRWFRLVRAYFRRFRYRNILTEDVLAFFNRETGRDLTAVFNQYLRHAAIPTLELAFDTPGAVRYRWRADEPGFNMPVLVGKQEAWMRIEPRADWQSLPSAIARGAFEVATDLFYVNVEKR